MKKITVWILLAVFVVPAIKAGNYYIEISKKSFMLTLKSDEGKTVFSCPIAYGLNKGDKECEGDCRTPEGTFEITAILDSSGWKHDFGDGRGRIAGAYGPFFIRLNCDGWKGIGIHGTCFPESIGTNATEGCIRVFNENIRKILKWIKIGDKVIILKEGE